MDRLEEIRQRTEAGGPILCIDMKYLLSEVDRLNEAHEAMLRDLQMRSAQVEALERERDEYKVALQNWHEDGTQEAGKGATE